MRGGLVVCGATSDAGKSWVVTGLCRLLARRGVRVAPFKGQNMALNAAVTRDGGEIGHAQWAQAVAAGVEPEVAMNPVLLKPTGERSSQVVVMGTAVGVESAREYHESKGRLRPVVLGALADLRRRYDVVVCEGAGGAAEINLLDADFANLPLAAAAGLPAVVVGDIDRGGVFASLLGTVSLLPDELRPWARGFVVNKFRGDPALLGGAVEELERRTGVPTLGVVPLVGGTDIDAEDSLALDRWDTEPAAATIDVAVVRFPHVANFGDLDPLRLEPAVAVRWVRSAAALGRPDLVVLPGSKSTRADLAWFRAVGLASAVESCGAAVVGICAGAQMIGVSITDPGGVEGPAGVVDGLGWLPLRTVFDVGKVLDRPSGVAVGEPGADERVSGYRIHNGRVSGGGAAPWLVAGDGTPLGWSGGRVAATTLHGLFEADALRAAVLRWATGSPLPDVPAVNFADARQARFDRIADALEASLDLDRLFALIEEGAVPPAQGTAVGRTGAGTDPAGVLGAEGSAMGRIAASEAASDVLLAQDQADARRDASQRPGDVLLAPVLAADRRGASTDPGDVLPAPDPDVGRRGASSEPGNVLLAQGPAIGRPGAGSGPGDVLPAPEPATAHSGASNDPGDVLLAQDPAVRPGGAGSEPGDVLPAQGPAMGRRGAGSEPGDVLPAQGPAMGRRGAGSEPGDVLDAQSPAMGRRGAGSEPGDVLLAQGPAIGRPGAGSGPGDVLPAPEPATAHSGAGNDPGGVLGGVAALVPHLRWRVGAPGEGDRLWTELVADADRLAAEVATTATGRRSDDPQVLASLWWQAYCYRVAGTTLAAWVVSGAGPDPAAPGAGVGLARSRPSSLLVDPGAAVLDDLAILVARLFDDNLAPMAASLRARHAVGTRLLHGNAAAAVASALGAVGTAAGAPPLRHRVDAVTAAIARPDEPDLGAWTGWDYRRTTCCLWFKTAAAGGALCEDCSLR